MGKSKRWTYSSPDPGDDWNDEPEDDWNDEHDYERCPTQDELRHRLGRQPQPVRGHGRRIAKTFWGQAWCNNLERHEDCTNRLSHGRTCVRNGKVLDLEIAPGLVAALVYDRSLYHVRAKIRAVPQSHWSQLREQFSGRLSPLVELLQGKISDEVMKAAISPVTGLLPDHDDVEFACSCQDWASMCKHVAAALCGIGVRLDKQPRLLFELRGIDPQQLISSSNPIVPEVVSERQIEDGLSDLFGVQIIDTETVTTSKQQINPPKNCCKSMASRRRIVSHKKAVPRKTPIPRKKTTPRKKLVLRRKVTYKKLPVGIVMTRKQLLARGLPQSTLYGWLCRRILLPTNLRGVYTLTEEALHCLRWYHKAGNKP